jgi:isoleucyl-tRNA synthetase
VKEADASITEEPKRRGVLWKAGKLLHAYPHCWRCSTPLLYYARESWFIRTTAFKTEMLERNARADWHPREAGEGRFGEWLKNNIDWAISRDRYWGTPLPVWVCDRDASHVEAVSSYAELAERVGAPLGPDFDPHKPFVDAHMWHCARCASAGERGTMKRVPEVIDAWFDSGAMPFAQWHFPFENREEFLAHYPADFIAEGVDQTRGWFYSLLAIATGLGNALPRNENAQVAGAAPYRSVVMNDLVLDAAGQKMSKSRGNTVDPWSAIERHGADAVRLFLVHSSQVWLPRRFDETAIRETSGRFLLTLRNVYSGIFAEYANFGWAPSESDPLPADRPLLDRWILSRLKAVEEEVDSHLEGFDATVAVRTLVEFVDEDVSKWYVRASRRRFYAVDAEDNRAAFATLHEVLTVVARLLAPFAPLITDWLHRELTGDSVHLAPFARTGAPGREKDLEAAMADVRVLSRLGRAAREEAGVKVRQPLSRMVCVTPSERHQMVAALTGLLREELNIKTIELATSSEGIISLAAKPNFRNLGRRFGKRTPEAAAAISSLSDATVLAFERGKKVAISVDGTEHLLQAEDFEVVRRAGGELVISEDAGYVAAVDAGITPELRSEGLMREVISRVQRMRKEAGLAVSDRITLWINGNAEVEEAVQAHSAHVAAEVLARKLEVGNGGPADTNAMKMVELDTLPVSIAIRKEQ